MSNQDELTARMVNPEEFAKHLTGDGTPALRPFNGLGTLAMYTDASADGELVGLIEPDALLNLLVDLLGIPLLDGMSMDDDGTVLGVVGDPTVKERQQLEERLATVKESMAAIENRLAELTPKDEAPATLTMPVAETPAESTDETLDEPPVELTPEQVAEIEGDGDGEVEDGDGEPQRGGGRTLNRPRNRG